jgi:signal transduction histidine kinase
LIDEKLLNSLETEEKEIFKKGLQDLIEQTYVIEDEYKKLNESYCALQDFIAQIIEVQPNALWVLDSDGEIFLQNSEAKKISNLLKHIDIKKKTHEVECNGTYYLVKVALHVDKLAISATDITEEKRKERLASMGQVAAHLSHEIRNPIGSVALLASTLFKRVSIENKPLVLEIRKSIWRVERIIKATLLFTKGVQPNFQYFNLKELEKESILATEQYTYSKDIDFEFNFEDIIVYGDLELLVLVIQNFIFNAIDAIEECEKDDGKVEIYFKEEEKRYTLSIMDNGKDIENKNILFEPFKTTKTKGHGLGLSLSLQIIKAHNGEIKLLENPKGFKISWEKKC